MNDEDLTVDQIVHICSHASLSKGTMTFDSYGTNNVRTGTLEFLANYGYTLEDAEEVVNSITRDDYDDGPIDNYDEMKKPRKLWIFKKSALGMRLYIKIIPFNKNKCIAVISFHEYK